MSATATLFVGALAFSSSASPQTFPTKPLRIIVASTTGGGADFVARLIGPKLTEAFGQQTIVENRPGGGATLGYEAGMRSAPDGYTLTLITPSYSINPSLYALKFDALTDYTPVVMIAKGPLVAIVHPSLPTKTMRDLIALARSKPGLVTYGTSGQGTIIHLATALFENMAGIKMTHIPYKGGAPALIDVIAGNIYVNFATPQTGLRQAKAGRVRALAMTSATRLNAAPELPTIAESGVPGYEVVNWQAFIAPRGTPRAAVERINTAVNQAIASRDMEEKLQADGVSPAGGTPEQLHEQIRKEVDVWRKTIAQAKIKLE
ncbi:MAG: tripartite tricarboxylate transporter substrate binding protein [Pseudomonadota bacterium]